MIFEEICRLKKFCVDEGEAFVRMAHQLRKKLTTERGRLRTRKLFVDKMLQQIKLPEFSVPHEVSSFLSNRPPNTNHDFQFVISVPAKTCQLSTYRERVRMHSPQICNRSRLRPVNTHFFRDLDLGDLCMRNRSERRGGAKCQRMVRIRSGDWKDMRVRNQSSGPRLSIAPNRLNGLDWTPPVRHKRG